jgi:Cu-Zn family superoxide dismutase
LKKTHGGPTDSERHIGDLGNIRADKNGEAIINITDSIALLDGPYSVMNRSIVIHQKADDLGKNNTEDSKKTGSAGTRLFCGIIGKV